MIDAADLHQFLGLVERLGIIDALQEEGHALGVEPAQVAVELVTLLKEGDVEADLVVDQRLAARGQFGGHGVEVDDVDGRGRHAR